METRTKGYIRVVTFVAGVAVVNTYAATADGLQKLEFSGFAHPVANNLNGYTILGDASTPAVTVASDMELSGGAIGGNIVVVNGATLTIAADVTFSGDVTITAEAGATVVVKNPGATIARVAGSGTFKFVAGVQALAYDLTLGEGTGKILVADGEAEDVYIAYIASDGSVVATAAKYDITWVIEGASTTEQLKYGATPAWSGAAPAKAADGVVSYSFAGWTPELAKVTGAATYTARFEPVTTENTVAVSSQAELEEALASGSDPVKIVLTGDIDSLEVPEGKNVEVDLNGHSIGSADGSDGEGLKIADSSGGDGAIDSLSGPAEVDLGGGTTLALDADDSAQVNDDGTVDIPQGSTPTVVQVSEEGEPPVTTTTETEVSGPVTVDPTPAEGEDVIQPGDGNTGAIDKTTVTTETETEKTVETTNYGNDGQPESTVTETFEKETDPETGDTTETLVKKETEVDNGDGTTTTTTETPNGNGGTTTTTETKDNESGETISSETVETDGEGNSVTKDGDGNITDISAGGEGEGSSTVDVKVGEGGSVEPVKDAETDATTGYEVTGPATVTLPDGTTVEVPAGTTVEVDKATGEVKLDEGETVRVTTQDEDGNDVTVSLTGPVAVTKETALKTETTDSETGTTTTETVGKDGDTTTETKDGDGKLTEVETGGNDGTSTESGEPEAGVKVTAGEGGAIEKDEATGVYTVTGPATITLPTDPETTMPVAAGETVTVAPDGTVTKVETDPETGTTTTETTGKDGNKTTETTAGGEGGGETLVEVVVDPVDGPAVTIEVDGPGGEEPGGEIWGCGYPPGDDVPGVPAEIPQGTYYVSGPATLTVEGGTTVAVESGTVLKVNDDGTIEVPEGKSVTVTKAGGEPETVTGPVTLNADGTTKTTTVDTETGETTTETKDGEGKLTEIETGGNDGTSTESGEPEAGVKVTAGEEGAIEKDESTGVYTVTGPATITLPTDPETTIGVLQGETVTVAPDGTVTKTETDPETGATTTETTGKDGNKTTETKDGEGNVTEVEAGGTSNGGDGTNDAPGVKVTLDEGSTGSIVDKGDGTWRVTGEATITLPTEPETVINVPKGKTVTVDSEGNVIETKTEDGVKTETVTKPDGTVETKVVEPGESGEYDEETTEGDGGALVRKTDKTTGAVVDEVYTPKGGEAVHSGEGGFAGWLDQTAVAEGKAVPVTAIALDAEAEGNGFTITFKPKLDTEAHKEKFTTWFDAMELAGRIKVRVSSDLANLGEATPQAVGKVSMDASADGTEESVTFTVDAATLKSLAGEDAKSAFFQVVVE